jgi:hypothetical protein
MNMLLLAGLLSVPAAAALNVESPEVWSRAQALLRPVASAVDLRVSYTSGGSFFNVDDAGLGIHISGQPGTNGSVRFSGRAGTALAFEAMPLSNTRPVQGYQFVSGALSARVVRFGDGLLIDGKAGGRPFSLTVERAAMPDTYAVVGRDGTRLRAWITPSYAGLSGSFDPEKTTREGLAVLGASIALMFSEESRFPAQRLRPAPLP